MPYAKDSFVWLKVDPADINFFNRIMEGYSHIGVLTTVNRKEGIVFIRCTPNTRKQAEKIAGNLPFDSVKIAEMEQ